MTAPPRVFPGLARGPQGHGPGLKGSKKAARRDVLLQCEACSAKASGRVIGGRLSLSGLQAHFQRGEVFHRGCGGKLVGFDIEVQP